MHDLQSALMNAPVIVAFHGRDFRFEWLNASARRAFGGRDPSGMAVLEVFPELGDWARKVIATVSSGRPYVATREPITMDWTGTGREETRLMNFACQPMRAADGTIEGSLVIAFDVTADESERALDPRDHAWIESTLGSIPTPVLLAEPGTRHLLFVNAAAGRLSHDLLRTGSTPGGEEADWGYFADEAGSRIALDELPLARAARGEVVEAAEVVWHAPFGVVPLVCFAERVSGTASLPSVIVVSLFDVSAAQRLERELLEETKTRDEFISLVAHELRTPLTTMRLHAQALLKKNPDALGVAAVERATSRMQDLVEELLTAEQLRELGIRLAPEDLDLCELVDEVIDRVRPEVQRAGSPVVRVGASELRGRWDRMRLQYVITLLIGNALRFGAGKPVSIRCLDLGDRVSVAVSDGGIGIDPADHERIFRRFGRAAPPRNFGGLGLGLWMARNIVTRMGGSIEVSSSRGHGATFTVDLPKATDRSVTSSRNRTRR